MTHVLILHAEQKNSVHLSLIWIRWMHNVHQWGTFQPSILANIISDI